MACIAWIHADLGHGGRLEAPALCGSAPHLSQWLPKCLHTGAKICEPSPET